MIPAARSASSPVFSKGSVVSLRGNSILISSDGVLLNEIGGDKRMNKKKDVLIAHETTMIDETDLFKRISDIIENRKLRAYAHANQETTLMFWEVGGYINSVILDRRRAEYGKKILTALSSKLVGKYGNSFSERNLYRMTSFAELFSDIKILTTLSSKLSWSHFVELFRLKSAEARLFYAQDAADRNLGIRELRHQISRKTYERREIANTELSEQSVVPFNVFKDPYLLDKQIDYFIEPKDDEDN